MPDDLPECLDTIENTTIAGALDNDTFLMDKKLIGLLSGTVKGSEVNTVFGLCTMASHNREMKPATIFELFLE